MTYRSNKYTLKNDLTCFTIEYGFCFHTMRRALCLSEKEKMASLETWIGLRYLRAKKRSGFLSFITLISILGITLGVAALITVLAVMSGFQKEIRTQLLNVAPHMPSWVISRPMPPSLGRICAKFMPAIPR